MIYRLLRLQLHFLLILYLDERFLFIYFIYNSSLAKIFESNEYALLEDTQLDE